MATINFRDTAVQNQTTATNAITIGASDNVKLQLGDVSEGARSSSSRVGGPITTTATVSSTTLYKLRGWNALLNEFEVWTSSDPYSSPPSLSVLVDVTYTEFNS